MDWFEKLLNEAAEDSVDDNLIGENNHGDIEDTIENNMNDNSLKSNIDNDYPSVTNNENDLILEKNTLTADSYNIHQVNPTNYSRYFNSNGYVLTDVVSSGDVIDLSGRFNKKNFIFKIPCSITSSQNDAFLTNCMVEFENVSSDSSSISQVSNLNFNTSIEKAPCVYILGSTYVEVFNCNAYSTGANSNPTFLVGSSYCHIHDNVFETTFTGYMNMSWKRAGILLGESHYNNISSNHVTVKDSNPIYLTTYGFEKSNYNIIYNNTDKIDMDISLADGFSGQPVYYEVSFNGSKVYTSETDSTSREGYYRTSYDGARVTTAGHLEPGEYTITFYAENGTMTRASDYVMQEFSDPAYIADYLSSLKRKWIGLFH